VCDRYDSIAKRLGRSVLWVYFSVCAVPPVVAEV
jgi:hypothetical protein